MIGTKLIRGLVVLLAAAWLIQFAATGSALEPDARRTAQADPQPGVKEATSIPPPPPRFVGVNSCAASNCHGGDGSRGIQGSEYSIWIQRDPHARAYSVLLNDVSRRMAELLDLDQPAHRAQVCLNCHAPMSNANAEPVEVAESDVLDGVSCEACHGAASLWLKPHVQKGWSRLPTSEKSRLGFADTKSLSQRATLCVQCHIGGAGDVTHDLYAAGHPRMGFELAAYHANLPPHWNRAEDPPEGKIWAVGQLRSAASTMSLLTIRATAAGENPLVAEYDDHSVGHGPWPELAETGCFACHHDLVPSSWRRRRDLNGRRLGEFPWQTWNLALTQPLAGHLELQLIAGDDSPVTVLRRLMSRPVPDRAAVAEQSFGFFIELNDATNELAGRRWSRETDNGLLKFLAEEGPSRVAGNWDSATQVYLGLAAVQQSRLRWLRRERTAPSEADRQIREALVLIREMLEFHPWDDSPRQFAGDRIEKIQAALKSIREAVGSEEE